MSSGLVTAIVIAGLAVIVVRRRLFTIGLVGAQSAMLGLGALQLSSGRSGEFLVASLVLVTKAAVLPALLLIAMRRTREPRMIAPAFSTPARFALAAAIGLGAGALTPEFGLHDAHVERAAIAILLTGIAIVALRRPALLQVIGLVVAENGVALLAISVPGGLSYVVELGAVFDLVLVVTVASAFAQRIHEDLGTGDTELLRGLRD